MDPSESTSNLAEGKGEKASETADPRKNFNYPLVKYCDMLEEMKLEVVDLVVTALERHQGNYEGAAKTVKETMDKKYGNSWHSVVGEGFGFEITHEVKNLLYMFFGGNIGVLLWKAL
ncbi:dynein light chain 4, axonemal-like protein [Piromyces finnis]|uniref:Dynein light chain n=1 Tax=Piromyces finnis TaxID=1754191 RepID=A0A1Y1V3X9_9FUNG|nr:dynein light chain 4, axonemal-like protein [Piromyces finnis]|eukprot:ORX46631.1 dynein light chain 4, axonemal-like protein [Piromyces finnis]